MQRRPIATEPCFSIILYLDQLLNSYHCRLRHHSEYVVENHFIYEEQQSAKKQGSWSRPSSSSSSCGGTTTGHCPAIKLMNDVNAFTRYSGMFPDQCKIPWLKLRPNPTMSIPALFRKLTSLLKTTANHLTNMIDLLNGLQDDANVNIATVTLY